MPTKPPGIKVKIQLKHLKDEGSQEALSDIICAMFVLD